MKDAKDIIIIIGLLFQYYFNISAPNIVLCIQCPSDQLDTPDVTTADAAREAAKKALSEMSIVTAPVQSTASTISGGDPISLVDWISSFLETLEKFHAVVDKIAMVSITLSPASPVDSHPMSRFILTCKQHGLSSLLFPRSGRCASLRRTI